MTAYDAIAEMAERELAIVRSGALEQLPALHDERAAAIASLPARPPASARAALERAGSAQAQVTAALDARMRAVAGELGRLGRGRSAVRGYMPSTAPARRVDRSG